ncbi:chemotaxis protein [Paracoccus onubensis]|uniref:Chemotaxis protein methyltransferase n=2 Tax=Paracoccus onubensis TaxID=1675788 RepID=A0A418SRG5_9RHOB|nr:chemotaxis protein [Paracoccus onubensis]
MIEAPALSDRQFDRLARIVRQDSGIVLTKAKRSLLAARLNRRLRSLNLRDYGAYCQRLEGADGIEERRHLLSAVTTNVTAFFREAHHFDALATEILPPLVDAARAGERIRLWSAACASGEEAYSIAMTLLDLFPDAARHDLRILATDIDPTMVARAEAGRYAAQALHPLGAKRLLRFFQRDGEQYTANSDLRAIIRFAELNLHDDWPFSGQFNVIFCRNAVIYFDAPARRRLWYRFARQIRNGGALFIGHSERLDGPAAGLFDPTGTTRFRRNGTLPPNRPEGE